MSILQLENIAKTYPGRKNKSLQGINLNLHQGEILSLLGPSGAGKTTLLRIIAGFEKPSSGQMFMNKQNLFGSNYHLPPEKRNIGMVFQDFALFPHLTVAQNVSFGLQGLSKKEKLHRTLEFLELVELENVADQFPLKLSGGQQQRVALARALAPIPKILLLDEPFSNLDARLRERLSNSLMDLLRKLKVTAVYVTHDTVDALAFADRVGVLWGGKLLQVDTPDEICARPNHRAVAQMVGKMNIIPGKKCRDGLETSFGTFYPDEYQENQIRAIDDPMIWLGLRPQFFIPWQEGVFQGSVLKTYCTPTGREAVVHYQEKIQSSPLPLIIPVYPETRVGEDINFNVLLQEATIIED